jgi:Xaa-Pro aminopeptidase
MYRQSRIEKLRNAMNSKGFEAVLIFSKENMRYFAGFRGTSGALIITEKNTLLLTDFRYVEQATNEAPLYEIIQHAGGLLPESVGQQIKKMNVTNLGVEEATLPIGILKTLKKEAMSGEFSSIDEEINEIRKIKDPSEIEQIKMGITLCDLAFVHILDFIKPGLSEKEIGLELEYVMKKNGAEGIKSNHVIASGERSALPHGAASERIVNAGEFVKMDIGAVIDGYYSDFTRTVVIGEPTEKQVEIYGIVRKAQEVALDAIGPGKICSELDEVARAIIRDAGYGDHFGHSLGHSLGLNIHEKPAMRDTDHSILEPGMVITVEPGIYLPGWGGVRIEDLLVITEDGYDNFTKATKDLQIISVR